MERERLDRMTQTHHESEVEERERETGTEAGFLSLARDSQASWIGTCAHRFLTLKLKVAFSCGYMLLPVILMNGPLLQLTTMAMMMRRTR